eukprot:COSAG05_NODE_19462_length_292_cov_0.911917_1_plen_39_part_01
MYLGWRGLHTPAMESQNIAIVGSGVTRGHKVWRWQGQAL